MNNKHTFTLIDGQFNAAEAKEVLINVFSKKIQFHELKNFSSKERFGKADAIALKRIPELKSSLEEILELLLIAVNNGDMLVIKSEVCIVVTPILQGVEEPNSIFTVSNQGGVVTMLPQP